MPAQLPPFATVGSATVTQMEAGRIFQRTSRRDGANGLGQALVPVSIAVASGAVPFLEYQLRNVSGGAVLQAWTALAGMLPQNTSTVYALVPAFLGWYYIDIRIDGSTVVTGTNKFAVGELIGVAGQSLAQTFINTSVTADATTLATLGITVSPYAAALVYYASNGGAYPAVTDSADQNFPPAWQAPADGTPVNSAGIATFLNLMVAVWGVPCAVVGYVVGGTGIATWLPGYTGTGSPHWAKLAAILTRAGGNFGAFFWDQGHYESKDGNTQNQYTAQLKRFFANLGQTFPLAMALRFKRVVGTIPAIGTYGGGPVACNNVRLWAKAWAATDIDAALFDGLDVTLMVDLVHPSQAGGIIFGQHVYRALANALGLLTFADNGPLITGASRPYGSPVITLPVNQANNGSAFVTVSTPINQFAVFPAGATSGAYTIASIDTSSASQIVLTLSAAPTEPAALDVYYRLPPDTSGIIAAGIYDNVIDGDGLAAGRQLALIPQAISIAAPPGFGVGVVANATAAAAIAVAGPYAALPAALDYSVDGGANWIAASSPTISGGAWSFSIAGGLTVGAYKLMVRDHTVTTTVGTSNRFLISPASPVTLSSTPGTLLFAWDAADPTASFQDAALTVPVVNGATVQGIADLSGNGQVFTQATKGNAPVYQVNVANGLPGLRFTGSLAQTLTLANNSSWALKATLLGPYFALVIYTPATLPSVAADVFYFSGNAVAGVTMEQVRFGEFRTNGSVYHNQTSGATIDNAIVTSAASANGLVDLIARWDGTTRYAAVNALGEITNATAIVWGIDTPDTYFGHFGMNTGGQYPLDGWIHEIRIYSAFGTTQNKTDARTYGTSKWGA